MDKNVSPYFDDGVEQFNDKDYKDILFNPSLPLQARELTQTQTLISEQSKQNLDMIYRDGSVIDGCVLTISDTTAYLSKGYFYHNGRIYKIDADDVVINTTGTQVIGLELTESIITSTEDPALNDPASGSPNYNLTGADRLKQIWSLVNITESSSDTPFILWELFDGVIVKQDEKSEYSIILDTLAERTFDESGHYLVNGMKLYAEDFDASVSTDEIKIKITPGKSYVKGYEIDFKYPHFSVLDKSQEFADRLNENITYDGSTEYNLSELYAKDISAVTAEVEITNMRIDHSGGVGSSDLFTDADGSTTYQNIILSSVVIYPNDGQPATDPFVITTDYLLSSANGGTIDWSPAGDEPTGSYYVIFEYYAALTKDVDYEFQEHATINDTYQLKLLGVTTPVSSSVMLVDYEYYLARIDLIMIDKDGDIKVNTGNPAHYREDLIPPGNKEFLVLGFIKLMPNLEASGCIIYEYNYKRLTMRELFNLKSRINDIEYNQAELALEADAQGGELPTNLLGILVDSFETFQKIDVEHSSFNCALNNIDFELTKKINYIIHTIDQTNDQLTNTEKNTENSAVFNSLTKTSEATALEITSKTDPVNLNPYTFLETPGFVDIIPRIDSWIDEEIIKISDTNSVVDNVTNSAITLANTSWLSWLNNSIVSTSLEVNNTTIKNTSKIEDTTIDFARQIDIQLIGNDWSENSRIDVFFDSKEIVATPTGTTTDITDGDGNHLVVESTGIFTATITIPPNTRTGEHIINFIDIDLDQSTTSVFHSEGINRLITERTITTRHLTRNRVTTIRTFPLLDIDFFGSGGRDADPIAQSFMFNEGKTFSGIDLYFKSDSTTVDAWLEIGYLLNGYPDQDSVFHHQKILANTVNTSANGTVATRIDFDKPIHIPADTRFFITLGSTSEEWYLYVSELGNVDLDTSEIVSTNAYIQGIFFKSSNNNTWSAFQNLDLTCKLIEGVYETTGDVVTENLTGLTAGAFKFETDSIIPAESDIKYYYSLDNGTAGTWNRFTPNVFKKLETLATQLRFKMELTGTGSSTPLINAQSYNLVTSSFDIVDDNYYITRTVLGVPAFNNIRVIFDQYLPAGCSITPEYTCDNGSNWYAVDTVGSVISGVYEGVDRVDFSKDITGDGLADETQVQFRIKLSNSANALYSPVVKNLKWIMKV